MEDPRREEDLQRTHQFRGLGVLCLCALLLAAGLWRFNEGVLPASSRVGGRELPIYCVETEKKQVALTFDTELESKDMDKILGILKKQGVCATFFMTGEWVEANPGKVKQIYEAGHDLANHGASHQHMMKLGTQQRKEEIMKVHDLVKKITGTDMVLFRPPYGEYNNDVIIDAKDLGYYTIQWDIDSLDWKEYGMEAIVNEVCKNKNLGNGSIILCRNGAKYTADALEGIIMGLKDQGYEMVPVSKLIYRQKYHMNHEGRQVSDYNQK